MHAHVSYVHENRNGVVVTGTKLRAGQFRVWVLAVERVFSLLKIIQIGPAYSSVGTGGFSPPVKRPRRVVYQPPISSAEVKNEWSCTANPKLCLEWHDRRWPLALNEFTLQIVKNWIPHKRPIGYCHVRKCSLVIMRILWRHIYISHSPSRTVTWKRSVKRFNYFGNDC